jgi:hypothetical protein
MEYKKKVIITNVSVVLLSMITFIIGHGNRSSARIYFLSYPLLFLSNITLGARYAFLKNRIGARVHFLSSIILLFMAIPLTFFVIVCIGGFC